MKNIFTSLLFALAVASFGHAAQFTDAMGREVTLSAPARRVVSLVPSVTETLFALGAEDRLVGVTTFCNYPPKAKTLPKVGSYESPSMEMLLQLEPDLVIGSADMMSPGLLSFLEDMEITVYITYPRNLMEVAGTMRQLGLLVGEAEAGERLAAELEEAVSRLRGETANKKRPRVLLAVMIQPLVVAGPSTLGNDLITAAGGDNVVGSSPARYPTWGSEALLAANPEVILTTNHGQPSPQGAFDRWPEVQAVASGRVVPIKADWIDRSGPRLVLGLEALALALHGEALASSPEVEGGAK